MQFSTGTEITYGADAQGSEILMRGDPTLRVVAPPPIWRLDSESSDGSRSWRLPKGKTLTRVHRTFSPSGLDVLTAHLDTLKPSAIHPAGIHGLVSEAKRLYPQISAAAQSDFQELIGYLAKEFGLTTTIFEKMPMASFTDDIGPELLVLVDGKPTPLPEMPILYNAPKIWRDTMWTAANSMIGPYADDELPEHQQISFMGVGKIPDAESPMVEGLIYYHGARFITIYEAWVGDPKMPLLRKFIRLILSGQRPWQTNILPLS